MAARDDGRHQRRARTSESASLQDKCHPRKIFVGGLASDTSTQDLRAHFRQFGAIVDTVVLRWPDGHSRGFGYVTFVDADAVLAALAASHFIDGREVDVKRAVPGTNKVFVGGLPQNASAVDLREHFESFGVVSDAVVMVDPATGRSRGFGFVCFAPGQEGAAAVAEVLVQYNRHHIHGKWIEVKSAAPTHKLAVAHEAADAPAQRYSPASTPPPCKTPPPATTPPTESPDSRTPDCGDAPLPKLLGPAGWAEPQKISFLQSLVAAIGAPPGLDTAARMPAPAAPQPFGHTPAAHVHPRRVPWPTGEVAWPAATAPPSDGGGAATLGAELQRSLEELVRLRLHGFEVGAPADSAAEPRSLEANA